MAGAAAGAGEVVGAAEEATVRAAVAAAGALVGAALAGAGKDSAADDPRVGAANAPDIAGAEACGVLRLPNENPTQQPGKPDCAALKTVH